MPWWVAVLLVTAWIFLAAKAHGRQVRLEREQQGVFHVEFGGKNPASVERIWAQDRRIFWPTFGALVVGTLALAALGWFFTGIAPADLGWRLAVLLAVDFAAAFTVSGVASWVRLTRLKQGPVPWRQRAQRGSVGWWLAVHAAAALTLVALWV